jgi:tetratricopeptide (TPR) repeat protein
VSAALHLLDAGKAENDGEVAEMGGALAAARAEFAAVGDAWGLAMALFIESGRELVDGRLEAARDALAQAAAALEGLDPDTGAGMLDVRMSDVLLRLGDLAGARERAERALARHDMGSDDTSFVRAMVARIALAAGDADTARAVLADAAERIERRGNVLPQYAHGKAMVESLGAIVASRAGELEEAERRLAVALPAALGTTDMPMVAMAGVAAATLAHARGRLDEAAEVLGAAAAIRGADDFTAPEIARLRDDARSAAYARGRALSREDALARLQDAVSGAAPVGP